MRDPPQLLSESGSEVSIIFDFATTRNDEHPARNKEERGGNQAIIVVELGEPGLAPDCRVQEGVEHVGFNHCQNGKPTQ